MVEPIAIRNTTIMHGYSITSNVNACIRVLGVKFVRHWPIQCSLENKWELIPAVVNRLSRQSTNLKKGALISRSQSLSKQCAFIADFDRSLVTMVSTLCSCSIRPDSELEEIV